LLAQNSTTSTTPQGESQGEISIDIGMAPKDLDLLLDKF
jgi:hypothetical protein